MASLKTSMPTLTLNDGHTMPQLAFGVGTALCKPSDDGKTDSKLVDVIKTAIAQGYRHLDNAEMYDNEAEAGKAIKDSKVPREELFVVTKVNPTREGADVQESFDRSLKRLGVDYVDLFLIHSPFAPEAEREQKLQEWWATMEQIQASGKARSIGVSNYRVKDLEATLKTAKVTPAVNQVEFHAYLQRRELLEFHKSKGIATVTYGSIAPATKAAGGPLDATLAKLAKKYYVSEGDICLRYVFEKGAAAVTTSSKEQRMSDYMRIIAFKFTPKEIEELDELGAKKYYRGFWTKQMGEKD